jgi:hypothetical protein
MNSSKESDLSRTGGLAFRGERKTIDSRTIAMIPRTAAIEFFLVQCHPNVSKKLSAINA